MTTASNALANYKDTIGKSKFDNLFPELDYEIDKDIRQAYKGGFTYLNPIYKEIDTGEGVVLDVNSLYPSVMKNAYLPFGKPIYFEGKYEYSFIYPLYIQVISCSFDLRPGKIPTIQLKNNLSFMPNEYSKSSN